MTDSTGNAIRRIAREQRIEDWTGVKLLDTLITGTLSIAADSGGAKEALAAHDEILKRLNALAATEKRVREECAKVAETEITEHMVSADKLDAAGYSKLANHDYHGAATAKRIAAAIRSLELKGE